jgi:hypothetical protein
MKLLKNSIICPLIGSMDSFTGGVYTSDGEFVEDSILDRGHKSVLNKPVEYLQGTYIYGGCLFAHFGHFIWESLSRLYTIRQCKNYPILFISPNDRIFNVQKMFFNAIGIDNEIILVKVSTSIENLIYSPPGSSISPLYIMDEQINSLKYFSFSYIPKKINDLNKKIWMSRSSLKYGKVINEHVIEEKLKELGYTIVHSETLSLYEQVKLISTSDVVAGFDGSAFFSLLFAKEIYGKFIIFNRRKHIPETIHYALERRHIEFKLCTFDVECISGNIYNADADYSHSEPDKVINVLEIS